MGYLYQASSSISDSALVTTSLWFRLPPAADFSDASGSRFITLCDVENADEFFCYVINFEITPSGGNLNPQINVFTGNPANGGAQWDSMLVGDIIHFGGWNHLIAATDTNHTGPRDLPNDPDDYKIGWLYLNETQINEKPSGDVNAPVSAPFEGFSRPGAFSCAFSGIPFGIPAVPARRTNSVTNFPEIQIALPMADFQMWVGQFIDLTDADNLANFVLNGKPVSPATARAAYGQQTVLLQGDHAAFIVNQGANGDFDLTGTLSDYDPGPSA